MINPQYPNTRMRRVRQSSWSRNLVSENRLSISDLIWPVFVHPGEKKSDEVESMPGVYRHSIDNLLKAVREASELGIPAIAIFPQTDPSKKTDGAE